MGSEPRNTGFVKMSGWPFPSVPSNYVTANFYRRSGGWIIPVTAGSPQVLATLNATLQAGYLYEISLICPVDYLPAPVTEPHEIGYRISATPDGGASTPLVTRLYTPTVEVAVRPSLRAYVNVPELTSGIFTLEVARTKGSEQSVVFRPGTEEEPTIFGLRLIADVKDVNFVTGEEK